MTETAAPADVSALPPLTRMVASVGAGQIEAGTLTVSERLLENDLLRVEFDDAGGFRRILDWRIDLEVQAAAGQETSSKGCRIAR